MGAYFLKAAPCTQKSEKVRSLAYLLKNNKVQQFVKFVISISSRTHTRIWSRSDSLKNTHWLIYNIFGNVNAQDILPGMWFKYYTV